MRNIAMSHLLPAVTASTVSGLADYVLSASMLRGACLGGLAGVVYSATHDILEKKFEVENGLIKHSMAVITSAVLTFGAAFITSAAGVTAMPSLASLGALLLTAIVVDALFRFIVDSKPNGTNNESPVSLPEKKLKKEAPVAVAQAHPAKPLVVNQSAPANVAQKAAIPAVPVAVAQAHPAKPIVVNQPTPANAAQKAAIPAVPKVAGLPKQLVPASLAACWVPVAKGAFPNAASPNAPNLAVPKISAQAKQPVLGAPAAAAQAVSSPASPSGVVQSPPIASASRKQSQEAGIYAAKVPLVEVGKISCEPIARKAEPSQSGKPQCTSTNDPGNVPQSALPPKASVEQPAPAAIASPASIDLDVAIRMVDENNDDNPMICPLSNELMEDPVWVPGLQDQHAYERKFLVKWLEKNPTSPISREPMKIEQLVPNKALRETIQFFKRMSKTSK